MSSARVELRALIDRVLKSHEKDSGVELAVKLGVVDSYVTKLRGGWRPGRVRPELMARLLALGGRAQSMVVREQGATYSVESPDYIRGRLDAWRDVVKWAVENQVADAAQLRAAEGPTSPSVDEVEEGAAILESIESQRSQKPVRHRKRA